MYRKKNILIVLIISVFMLGTFNVSSFAWTLKSNNVLIGNSQISPEKAEQEFLKYGKPRLMFVRPWNSNTDGENRKLKLIYSIVNGPYYYFDFNAIDAVSGKPVNSQGKEIKLYYEKLGEEENPELNQKTKALEQPLTEETAKEMAVSKAIEYGINISTKDICTSKFDTNWSGLNQKVYSFSWSGKEEENKYTIRIVIDYLTGYVLEVNCRMNDDNSQINMDAPITWQEGKANAISFLSDKFPQFIGNIVFMQSEPNYTSKKNNFYYYYSFWRTVNGVLYPENNINIIVNNATGNIVGYGYRWENIDFPVIGPEVLSEAYASDIFMSKIGITLKERPTNNGLKQEDGNTNNYVYEAIMLKAAYIDPYTGKLKNSNGEDISGTK